MREQQNTVSGPIVCDHHLLELVYLEALHIAIGKRAQYDLYTNRCSAASMKSTHFHFLYLKKPKSSLFRLISTSFFWFSPMKQDEKWSHPEMNWAARDDFLADSFKETFIFLQPRSNITTAINSLNLTVDDRTCFAWAIFVNRILDWIINRKKFHCLEIFFRHDS